MTTATFEIIPYKEIKNQSEKPIGSGGYANVYKANYHAKDVAIKILKTSLSKDLKEEFEKEARVMASLNSSHSFVCLHGICQEPDAMVMEFMPNGDLEHLLKSPRKVHWTLRWRFALDISYGIQHLHKRGIIHRDLKSSNILLDREWRARITDFGLSRIKKAETKYVAGTKPWMAPELFIKGKELTPKSDIWAYGMVLWEIAARKTPHKDAIHSGQIVAWIIGGELEDIPKDCNQKYAELILKCWKQNPKERPTAEAIVQDIEAARPKDKVTLPKSERSERPRGITFGLLKPVPHFTGREDEQKKLKKALITPWKPRQATLTCLITGRGGMGKRELVYAFINEHRSFFTHVIWIDCEAEEASFRGAALKLKIPGLESMNPEEVRQAVYARLGEGPWLLVFHKWQKEIPYPKDNGCVLIIKQVKNTLVEDMPTIDLQPFTENEAIELVQYFTNDSDIASIKRLIKTSGHEPLLIATAAKYIGKTGKVKAFLDRKSIQPVVNLKHSDRYNKSYRDIWKHMLESFKKDFPVPYNWLLTCVHFQSENIPARWAKSWISSKSKKTDVLTPLQEHLLIHEQENGHFAVPKRIQALLSDEAKPHFKAAFELVSRNRPQPPYKKEADWLALSHWGTHAEKIALSPNRSSIASKELGNMYYAIADMHFRVGNFQSAKRFAKKSLSKRKDAPLAQAQSLFLLGNIFWHLSKYDKALKNHRAAYNIYTEKEETEHLPSVLQAMARDAKKLADYQETEKHLADAKNYALEALKYTQKNEKPLDLAQSYYTLGSICCTLRDNEEALRHANQSLENENKLKKLKNTGPVHDLLGTIYENKKDFQRAIYYYKKGLADAQSMYPKGHPSIAVSLMNLGIAYQYNKKYDEALKHLMGSLKMRISHYGEEHSRVAKSKVNIASLYHAVRMPKEAKKYIDSAVAIYEKVNNRVGLIQALQTQAAVLDALGEQKKAIESLNKAYYRVQEHYGEDHLLVRQINHDRQNLETSCMIL